METTEIDSSFNIHRCPNLKNREVGAGRRGQRKLIV